MLGVLTALLLNSGPALPATDLDANDLPGLFAAACLDGEARLSPGSAASVGVDALPRELLAKLGKPASGQVWRLNGAGDTFLYILNYAPGRDANPRICGLASDEMDSRAAAQVVEKRVTGHEYDGTPYTSLAWTSPQGGYSAVATKAGKFNVVQVNWFSDAQRAAAMKAYGRLVP